MGASKFINYLNKKSLQSNIVGGRVRLDTLEPGDYFYLNVHHGVIGKLMNCGINATVKWVIHPEKSTRAEWIASGTRVYKYNYE
ncbi:hypothetical protein [uncultured virus]|uniref:Uncharacterized protein n=1 Tax=uncultured virus TaxID=340016 RepID=A0A218MKQ8_9VIRU|nr:hypothetical protein [uncultured virus]